MTVIRNHILNPGASNYEIITWANSNLEHFFSFIVKPQLDLTIDQKKLRPLKIEDCQTAILATFKSRKGVERDTIKDEMQKMSFAVPTMDRALEALVRTTKIGKPERGKYDIP